MAWIRPRKRKDESSYFSVYYRDGGRGSAQRSISFNDYADAQHAANLIDKVGAVKALEILRIVQDTRQAQTVEQFLTKHIDHLTGIEKGTVARYRAYVRNDLGPLADLPLAALTRDDISRWIAAMQDKNVSGKTIANKHGFLAGALNSGVQQGVIKINPCDGNRLPRWDRREMVFLERDEYAVLRASFPEYWQPLVDFLVSSGCRWSEASALKPADIDLAAGTARISKAWKTGAGGYTLGVPKTRKSVRTVNIPERVLTQLDLTGEWVFTNRGRGQGQFADGLLREDNNPVRIHMFNPRVWTPAVARAQKDGLTKKVRVHDLRHTCASWLLQAGRPLTAVQAQLGHESIQVTVDVYGHLDRSSGQGNADAIDAMLGPLV